MAQFTNLPVDLVIVRHGQSEANMMIEMTKRGDASATEAMRGAKRHDSEMRLTDTGRAQARTVGQGLSDDTACRYSDCHGLQSVLCLPGLTHTSGGPRP